MLPTVFTDRNLGSVIVPRALRSAGLTVVTMAEHYGDAAESVADIDWIAEVAGRGWVAFHQDARIRRRVAEAAVVRSSAARMFCVPNGNITGRQAAARFVDNMEAIAAAALEPGPYIYGVYPDGIRTLRL